MGVVDSIISGCYKSLRCFVVPNSLRGGMFSKNGHRRVCYQSVSHRYILEMQSNNKVESYWSVI